MDILLIPCIIRILMLRGRVGSFFLKKYAPTSPSDRNPLKVNFFSFLSSCSMLLIIRFNPYPIFTDNTNQFINGLSRWYTTLDNIAASIQRDFTRA